MIFLTHHRDASAFFEVAGIQTKEQRAAYLNTQVRCFIEEAEEIGETLFEKDFDNTGELKEAIADDVGDTCFSGIGVLYAMLGKDVTDSPYDYIDEYFELLDLSEPEVDSAYFTIKTEIKNLKAFLKRNKKNNASVSVVENHVLRIIANAIWIAEQYEVDAGDALDKVIVNNMEKFDSSQDDALTTQKKYLEQGIDTRIIRTTIKDGNYYDTHFSVRVNTEVKIGDKVYPFNKILKSHLWKEPEFGYKQQVA